MAQATRLSKGPSNSRLSNFVDSGKLGQMSLMPLPAKVRSIFRKPGIEAHLYMFGPGVPILGPELVVNGDGATVTGWTGANATASVQAGEICNTGTGPLYPEILQDFGTVAGREYLVTGSSRRGTSANPAWALAKRKLGAANLTSSTANSSQVYAPFSFKFVAQDDQSRISLVQSSGTADTGTVLFDNISVREILGYSNTYSGFSAGNYFDSAGTTHASVDSSVGLVLDAAGSVGAELAVQSVIDVTIRSAWGVFGGCLTPSAKVISLPSVGSELLEAAHGVQTANKTFNIVASLSGTGTVTVGVSNGIDQAVRQQVTLPANLSFHGKFNATNSNVGGFSIQRAAGDTATSVTLDSYSYKEVTGIHATQATPGYKPTLRRGIVNLSVYSRPNSNQWPIGISGTGLAPVITHNYAAAPDGSMTASRVQLNKGAGVTSADFSQVFSFSSAPITGRYTTALWVRTTDGLPKTVTYRDGNSYGPVSLDGNWKLLVEARDFTGQTPGMGVRMRGGETTDSAADLLVWDAGLFAGTLTAAQILAAGGIPLTTTAPASSVAGVNYAEFDGVDDVLALPGPLFQQADDHCVVAAVSPSILDATYRRIFTQENGQATAAEMEFTNFGVNVTWRDDATTAVSLVGPVPTAGTPFVFSARKVGNTRIGRFNAVTFGSNTTPLGATALNSVAYFGNRATLDRQLKGKLFPSFVIKGTVSDADLAELEKFIAKLSGVQL